MKSAHRIRLVIAGIAVLLGVTVTAASADTPVLAPAAGTQPSAGPATATVPAAPVTASSIPQVQICVPGGECLNRKGGGTGGGTEIIYWSFNDPNNDFTFLDVGAWVCGKYDTVHNGENGCLGPFTNGSGLNARYDGKPLFRIWAYNEGLCAAVPNYFARLLDLGNCTAQGTVYVYDTSSNSVIGVGESNYEYGQDGLTNDPYWMYAQTNGFQVETNVLSEQWFCEGNGIGSC